MADRIHVVPDNLRQAAGHQFQSGPNRHAVALRACQLKTHPVIAGDTMVLENHGRAVQIVDDNVHLSVVE